MIGDYSFIIIYDDGRIFKNIDSDEFTRTIIMEIDFVTAKMFIGTL